MARIAVLLCVVLVAAGCASSSKTEGQKQVETLGKNLTRCTDSLAKLETALKALLTEHDAIVNNTDGNYAGHYDTFSKGMDKLEKSRELARARYDEVSASAGTYFATWKSSSEQFTSDDLRKKSEKLLEKLQSEFGDIWKGAPDAKAEYDALLAVLRDHRLFWSTGVNATTAAEMKRDEKKLRNSSEKVFAAIAEATKAATEFQDTIAQRAKVENEAAPKKPSEGTTTEKPKS